MCMTDHIAPFTHQPFAWSAFSSLPIRWVSNNIPLRLWFDFVFNSIEQSLSFNWTYSLFICNEFAHIFGLIYIFISRHHLCSPPDMVPGPVLLVRRLAEGAWPFVVPALWAEGLILWSLPWVDLGPCLLLSWVFWRNKYDTSSSLNLVTSSRVKLFSTLCPSFWVPVFM